MAGSGGHSRGALLAGCIQAAATLGLMAQVALGQSSKELSCVQTVDAQFSSCPCDAALFTFSLEGQTSLVANTVNLAMVVDESPSIDDTEWEQEQTFVKDTATAFAARKLFDNGGTASYVSFTGSANHFFTETSEKSFNDAVDAVIRSRTFYTNIRSGIAAGRDLLSANPATANIMIVLTDGEPTGFNNPDPTEEAAAARAEGTIVFAVGVGTGVLDDTLLAIGGHEDNVFSVTDFDQLNLALEEILSASGGSVVPCPATGVTVSIDFFAPVSSVSYPGASISGSSVNYTVADLESNPTTFDATLDTCAVAEGTRIVTSSGYTDDQGNMPDLSSVVAVGSTVTCGDGTGPTPAPRITATDRPSAVVTTPPHVTFTVSPAPSSTTEPTGGTPPGGNDCSVCDNLTRAQEEALATYDNGGKRVVCDPTCVDGVSDPSHCNYFGLGQICRGCGTCSVCTPCP